MQHDAPPKTHCYVETCDMWLTTPCDGIYVPCFQNDITLSTGLKRKFLYLKMISKLLCTDILSIRCIGDFIFIGMGCSLLIYEKSTYKLKLKVNCFPSHNIHGIVNGPDNNIVIFGASAIRFYQINFVNDELILKELSDVLHFPDWIITAKWVTEGTKMYLSVLFAHNNVHIYNPSNSQFKNVQCKERCILYGGSLSQEDDQDIIIFSGTVFQEILIWKVKCNIICIDDAIVLHRLTGHNGVIFSVVYDPFTNLICSTSDDRTVRLWKVLQNQETSVVWPTTKIVLLKTMFGHTARVWRSIINSKHIITIGEDSLICKWSLDGILLDKIQAHHGAPIWSIDVCNNDKIIYTGGADGACYAWNLVPDKSPMLTSASKNDNQNVPKYIGYLNSGAHVVFVEGGKLLYYEQGENVKHKSLYLEKYKTYCIMQISPCRTYITFASREGHVTIYKENQDLKELPLQLIVEENIMKSQILSLQWLDGDTMIICGPDGMLKVLQLSTEDTIIVQAEYILPSSRERWLTAAIIYDKLLACGDRAGNLHIFGYPQMKQLCDYAKFKQPMQLFAKVHGKIGIQSFAIFERKLITTGRDGFIRVYEKDKSVQENSICFLHGKKMPMDWIGGNIKTDKDLLVLGFKEVEFLIYSMSLQRLLMRIPCGGGHRSWDCVISKELVNFAYLRSKQIYSYSYSLKSCPVPIILSGFHVKEVYSMQTFISSNQQKLFVSGGEDCALRISYISHDYTLQTLGIYDGHISSIKTIAIANLQSTTSHNKYLVFSGGGRAQMKVWRVNVKIQFNEDILDREDISCADLNSHMLNGKDQYRKKSWKEAELAHNMEPETRYMDINIYTVPQNTSHVVVFVACADGFIRVFTYNMFKNIMLLRRSIKCGNRCILKVHTVSCCENIVLLTMMTNGTVQFFNVTDIVAQINQESCSEEDDNEIVNMAPFHVLHFHQSGINCFDFKTTGQDQYLLLTGGDDNLLNLVSFKMNISSNTEHSSILTLANWCTSAAHSTQITGIKFTGSNQFYSVGMDQRVIMYTYVNESNTLSVAINSVVLTSIPDVQGLSLYPCAKSVENLLCVYGKGFELLSI